MAKKKNQLVLTRGDALAVFLGLGFKSAENWPLEKMASQLSCINDIVDDDTAISKDPAADAILRRVLQAIADKADVTVVDGERTTTDDAKPGVKDGPKGKQPAKEKDEPKGKEKQPAKEKDEEKPEATAPKPETDKQKPERDRFGCRVNTQASQLAACLTEEPKTMKQLVDESGSVTQYNLMKKLSEKGLVIKTDDGYKLADAAA